VYFAYHPHPSHVLDLLFLLILTPLFFKFCTDAKIMAWEIQVTAHTFYKVTSSAIQYTLPVRQFPNCLINEAHNLYWNTKITTTKGEGQNKGTFFLFLTYTLYSGADEDVSVLEKRNFTSLDSIISHRLQISTYKLLYTFSIP
jgi:hypothetical protein